MSWKKFERKVALRKKFCRTCLFYEGMRLWLHPITLPHCVRDIRIEEDGRCNVCHHYEQRLDLGALGQELDSFLQSAREKPVVLLFSGGKDSTACLSYLRTELDVEVIAMLYQPGFIPSVVLEQSRSLCESLGAKLQILTRDDVPSPSSRTMKRQVEEACLEEPTPCITCASHLTQCAIQLKKEFGADWIVQGTNYYAVWNQQPSGTNHFYSKRDVSSFVNLPYLLRWKMKDNLDYCDRIGYDPAKIAGCSSNCLVPDLMMRKVSRSLGHVPELEDLSLEVLVGHVTREEAIEKLKEEGPQFLDLIEGID